MNPFLRSGRPGPSPRRTGTTPAAPGPLGAPARRFRPVMVTMVAVLAGAVVVGPAAVLPAAAVTPAAAAAPVFPASPATPAAPPSALTTEEHGFPGYFRDLSVVEDTLSAQANRLTMKADFCIHPGATTGDSVGFGIMWDAPISSWEVLVGLDETYTSSVPVTNDAGETVMTADMVFAITEPEGEDDWIQELKTTVDLNLAPGAAPSAEAPAAPSPEASATSAGSCGTLELPVAAPLALADVVESQPEAPEAPEDPADPADPTEPADPTDPTDPTDPEDEFGEFEEFDPYAYIVEFVDRDGRRSSDQVQLNPTELPSGEAWVSGQLDFTGSTYWLLLSQSGPSDAAQPQPTVVLQDDALCEEPYEALIVDTTSLMPTNQEPDLAVSCEDGIKTFTLENRLRTDRQLVVSQFDPRPGAEAVTHELTADFTVNGATERRTAAVTSAAPHGRITGDWTAPAACPAPFADNAPGSAYQREVRWMQCWSITEGYRDNTYRKDRSISRGESVAFLYRYSEQIGDAFPLAAPGGMAYWENEYWFEENPFWDVDEEHTFFEPIGWAFGMGLTEGYWDGSFGSERPVTRGELAAFAFRLVDGGFSDDGSDAEAPFSDVPAGHTFDREITWLAEQGIATGYRDGTFRPAQKITRGEVARVLSQLHEQMVKRP